MKKHAIRKTILGRLQRRALCVLCAMILAVCLMPPLSALAEDFTFSVTVSGAANGNVSHSQVFELMSGQSLTFNIKGSEGFSVSIRKTLWVDSPFSISSVNDISEDEKTLTITAEETEEFIGDGGIIIYFSDPEGTSIGYFEIGFRIKPFKVKSVSVSPENVKLRIGETVRLTAAVAPDYHEYTVDWDSGNKSVATVSQDGVVTAIAIGNATIYAFPEPADNLLHATCRIEVVDQIPAESVTVSLAENSAGFLSDDVLTLAEGETAQLEAALVPSNSTNVPAWSGGNDCASLDSAGKITALKKGSAEVSVSAGEKSKKITVRVLEHHAAVASTCTEKGTVEYWEDADGNLYGSKDGTTPINDLSAPLAAHTVRWVDSIPAGCEDEGSAEHYKCTVCGALFSDAEGKNKIDAPETLPPLGHDFGDWHEKTAPTVGAEGVEERVCSRDSSHTETRVIPAVTYAYSADGYTWTLRSGKPLSVTINRSYKNEDTFGLFARKIEIDGNDVGEANYTAESGSLNVSFKASYLDKLSAGKHSMKTYFTDGGCAATTLKIKSSGSGSTPGTGDDTRTNDLVSGMILFIVSLSFVSYTLYANKFARAKLLAAFSGAQADVQEDESDDITPEEHIDGGFDDTIHDEPVDDGFDEIIG